MLLEQYLQNIGLDAKEAKVYLAGLQLGPATIVELSASSGVKRSTVYQIIGDLKDKSLVNVSLRNKRKIFTMQEPDNLYILLKQKENILKQIMPDLEALKNVSAKKPAIRIFEGVSGLQQIYEDMIKKPGEILCLAAPKEKMSQKVFDYLVESWEPRRIAGAVEIRRININYNNDWQLNNRKMERPEEKEAVFYWPQKDYPFTVGIYIYRQKVAFVSFGEKELVGIIIRSPEINLTLKLMFEMFWNRPSRN